MYGTTHPMNSATVLVAHTYFAGEISNKKVQKSKVLNNKVVAAKSVHQKGRWYDQEETPLRRQCLTDTVTRRNGMMCFQKKKIFYYVTITYAIYWLCITYLVFREIWSNDSCRSQCTIRMCYFLNIHEVSLLQMRQLSINEAINGKMIFVAVLLYCLLFDVVDESFDCIICWQKVLN